MPLRLTETGAWHLDADLFLSDLANLQLDARTERCLRESLDAYRRELYLACASLLGATSEGAWYAAAQSLAPISPNVRTQLERERESIAAIQAAVTTFLREQLPRNRRWEADDLATYGDLLRSLRNYGVHPRPTSAVGLERFFEEDACGLLLLNTYQYLTKLAVVVEELATAFPAAPSST